MADILGKSVPLEHVLKAELAEIEEIRRRRAVRWMTSCKTGDFRKPAPAPAIPISGAAPEQLEQDQDKDWVDAIKNAHAANLVGLAFSGGGIRSATFNLGVLQALADLKLLYRIDYLSTVSGGGYIGGWLAAWTKRARNGFAEVQNALAPNRVHQLGDKEPTPIRFLRVFSNYLTPKLGIFSGDTCAAAGILLRNMLLNQVIVLALLSAVLLAPRAALKSALAVTLTPGLGLTCIGVAIGLLMLAFFTIVNNMADLDGDPGGVEQWTAQSPVLTFAGLPLFATATLGALWLAWLEAACKPKQFDHLPYDASALVGAIAYGGIWVLATLLGLAYREWLAPHLSSLAKKLADLKGETGIPEDDPEKNQRAAAAMAPAAAPAPPHKGRFGKTPEFLIPWVREFAKFLFTWISAIAAGALAGLLYAVLSAALGKYSSGSMSNALVYGVPLAVAIFLLTGTLHLGLMGTVFPDRRREWWGRLTGWLLVWALAWLAIFWLALCFPHFIHSNLMIRAGWKTAATVLTPAWIATTLGGVLAGKSKASGKPGALTWMDVLAKVAPYVFVVGLLCWISWGIDRIQGYQLLTGQRWINDHRLFLAIFGCLVVAMLMSWRVDINQFSMHMFYRNRLVRAYLGASNLNRSPNRFTGFDCDDDIHLKDFSVENDKSYDGPYPILNSSLNLVKGQDLAWQERKAESFVMTPRFCGYDVWLEEQDTPIVRGERPLTLAQEAKRDQKETWLQSCFRTRDRYGYRPTEEYAFPPPQNGPDLGLAMGISGAAASPNMGFYTSTPVSFLMTIFNVRLGQWLGNPRNRRTSRRATPWFGLSCLVNELLAGTDDKAAYVYLSDGGHFENMALYELVKRRCGLIIVCDAEADEQYCFGGLGNAIRKCRIDLGIDIVLDVADIKPKKEGKPSQKHCAVGQIHYENVDLDAPTGTIIYFKASMTGDEPADVKNYAKMHSTFPHETTVDQWFSESQFESYRVLGYHEVTSSIPNSIRPVGLEADTPSPDPGELEVLIEPPKHPASPAAESAAAQDHSPKVQWEKRLGEFGFDVSYLRR